MMNHSLRIMSIIDKFLFDTDKDCNLIVDMPRNG